MGPYATADGGELQYEYQVPPSVNDDGNIDADEFVRVDIAGTETVIVEAYSLLTHGSAGEFALEIGTGAIEGAVRQIVAIRFDGPGMRWGDQRPQLLLHMICLRLNGAWDHFTETIIQWAHQSHYRRRLTTRRFPC